MSKFRKLVRLLIASTIVAGTAGTSVAFGASSQQTGWFQIGRLTQQSAGYIVISASGGIDANPAGCSYTDYAAMTAVVNNNADAKKAQDSLLLAAFLSGKNVRLGISGTECYNNRPAFYSVDVEQ